MVTLYTFILVVFFSLPMVKAQEPLRQVPDAFTHYLPRELQEHIYSFLDLEELVATSSVSKLHQDLSRQQCDRLLRYTIPYPDYPLVTLAVTQYRYVGKFPWHLIKAVVQQVIFYQYSSYDIQRVLKKLGSSDRLVSLVFDSYDFKYFNREGYPPLYTQVFSSTLNALPRIQILSMENYRLTDKDLPPILPALGKAEELHLSNNKLTGEGLKTLSLNLSPHLTTLSLSDNPIGEEGFLALAKRLPNLKYLRVLSIGTPEITPEGFSEICANLPSSLENLILSNCDISDERINFKEFTKALIISKPSLAKLILLLDVKYLAHLHYLSLSYNRLSSWGITLMSSLIVGTQAKLSWQRLNLGYNCDIDDDAVESFISLIQNLPHLTHLMLNNTSLSPEAIAKLRQVRPSLEIEY